MKHRKTLIAAALLGLSLSLTGCATAEMQEASKAENAEEQPAPRNHYSFEQELPDGEKVLCVWAKDGYGGGLSCDWEGLAADRKER